MNFIDCPIALDEEIYSPDILRSRREKLGFSQQDVADGARIQLRQYQRLESGERSIEGATMKTAMAVCAVLKLNPFIFFREAESMNRYRELLPRDSDAIMKKEEAIPLFLQKACDLYNEQCRTNYSLDNIKVAYCTMNNITEVYRSFTKQYDFHSENRTKKDFECLIAEAFVGQTNIDDPRHVDGLLIRTDPPEEFDRPDYYMIMIVHELSHIFCTTHEIPTAGKAGQRFYDLYCEDTPGTPALEYNNGYMNAGYAIWREFIADIVGDLIYQQPNKHLQSIDPVLKVLANEVRVGNSGSKSAFHRYLSEIMNSWEGSEAETWEELKLQLENLNLPFIRIVEHVFNNLHGKSCHEIDPDFIERLGEMYLEDMIKNTKPDDLARFAASYGFTSM